MIIRSKSLVDCTGSGIDNDSIIMPYNEYKELLNTIKGLAESGVNDKMHMRMFQMKFMIADHRLREEGIILDYSDVLDAFS